MKKITLRTIITVILPLLAFLLLVLYPVTPAQNANLSIGEHRKENPFPSTVGRKTVGLALGSGGARGLAHIGVIKALEENGIPIDYIAGASSGALVGGLYATTFNSEYLESIAASTNWRELIGLIDLRLDNGIIAGNRLTMFIESHIGATTFNELGIPLTVLATDLRTGESVEITSGKVSDAIRASVSLPFVFSPIERDEQLLLDGGLTEPVPVQAVRAMGADIVIAVNLDAQSIVANAYDKKINAYTTTLRSLDILRYQLVKENVTDADIVLVPQTGEVLWHEFVDDGTLIQAGERAVEEQLDAIRALIK